MRLVGEIVVDDTAQPGEMEQQQHACCCQDDEHQQDPGAFPMHTVLNHLAGNVVFGRRQQAAPQVSDHPIISPAFFHCLLLDTDAAVKEYRMVLLARWLLCLTECQDVRS
jgi:hypothetical protein